MREFGKTLTRSYKNHDDRKKGVWRGDLAYIMGKVTIRKPKTVLKKKVLCSKGHQTHTG